MIRLAKKLFGRTACQQPRVKRQAKGLGCERLEKREVMDGGPGKDFVLSGFTWNDPSKITYSYPADGANWDYGVNNLNQSLGNAFASADWKREFARALQTWAAAANINVVPVADSNVKFNAYGKAQGDPNFGDIRVGGYDFHDSKTLAQTYYPPPNSVSAAGDIEVNTGFDWKPGSSFDFFSVMLHESGHSLGLAHSPQSSTVMNERYGGVRSGLTPSDIEGIQALYGPRIQDANGAAGKGTSLSNAVDVSGNLRGMSGAVSGVWLTSIGETDYYSVTVPSVEGASFQTTAVAAGMSSLSPKITVYDTAGNPLGSQSDASNWANNVSVTVPETTPGEKFLIGVTGATNDVFAVGAYQLRVEFVGGNVTSPPPTIPPTPPPPTPTPPPSPAPGGGGETPVTPEPQPVIPPPDRFEPNNSPAQAVNLGVINQSLVAGLTLNSVTDTDYFRIQAARAGTATLLNTGALTRVLNQAGQLVAAGVGQISFKVPRAGARFLIVVTAPGSEAVSNYAIGMSIQPNLSRAQIRALTRGRVALKIDSPEVIIPSVTPPTFLPWVSFARPRFAQPHRKP